MTNEQTHKPSDAHEMGGSGQLDIKSFSREAVIPSSPQTSGVRESRVRGGAATRPSLAAVAVCGGLQKRNLATRAGRDARGLSGLTCHGHGPERPRKKEIRYKSYRTLRQR